MSNVTKYGVHDSHDLAGAMIMVMLRPCIAGCVSMRASSFKSAMKRCKGRHSVKLQVLTSCQTHTTDKTVCQNEANSIDTTFQEEPQKVCMQAAPVAIVSDIQIPETFCFLHPGTASHAPEIAM